MAVNWSRVPFKYMAVAVDAMGMQHGFTTPPQFYAMCGEWRATGNGVKAPLFLQGVAPGDTAGGTVEYRPGKDPGPGKRPMPVTKANMPETSLAIANREKLGVAKDVEGVPPPTIVAPTAPGNHAPPSAAPAAPVEIQDHTVRQATSDLDAGVTEAPAKPSTPLTIVLDPSAAPKSITMSASSIHMPTSGFGHIGDPLPHERVYIGDPPMGPGQHPLMWPAPSYTPAVPVTPGGDIDWTKVITIDRAKELTGALGKYEPPVTRQEYVQLAAKIEALTSQIKHLIVLATKTGDIDAALAALKPKPELLWIEKQVDTKLAELDREKTDLLANGTAADAVTKLQEPQRAFWAQVKEARDAKIALGATP